MTKNPKTRTLGMYSDIDATRHVGEDPYDYLDRMDEAVAKWERKNIPDEALTEFGIQIRKHRGNGKTPNPDCPARGMLNIVEDSL